MKKSIKYIALAIGSVGVFLFSLVFFSILSDYLNTNYDVSLILPMLCIVFLVAAIVCTIVLSFCYASDKKLKTILAATIILFSLSATFHILGRVINPYVNTTNNTPIVSYTKNIVDKDVFLDKFFKSLTTYGSRDYEKVADTTTEDGKSISKYSITDLENSFISNFYIIYNNDSNTLESVSITGFPDESPWIALIFNICLMSLNEYASDLDQQCGLAPYNNEDSRVDTNSLSILKTSSENLIYVSISIK